MFKWNVEEQKLRNMSATFMMVEVMKYSREEKIEFINWYCEYANKRFDITYVLDLKEKLLNANLKKDDLNRIKTTSLKAWLKKNDIKNAVDRDYSYGQVYFLGCKRNIQSDIFLGHKSYGSFDSFDDYVDEITYRVFHELKHEEEKWFEEHDEYHILHKQLKDTRYVKSCYPIGWSSAGYFFWSEHDETIPSELKGEKLTIDEMKKLIEIDEELKDQVRRIIAVNPMF